MREVWALRRFVYSKLLAIPNRATLAPAGVHEDELPSNADPTKIGIVYQVETERVLRGMGAVVTWGDFQVLVDVVVPGAARSVGEAASNAVYDALHGVTGAVAGGFVSSCVYDGTIPMPTERDDASGNVWEHLMQRFLVHAKAA